MSRKANPALVGIFVIAAVALLTTAIIIFGKGKLFKETSQWVLYFEGSIKGLSPGSPVVFQGVRIGDVRDIRIHIDDKNNITTPVIMEVDSNLIDFDENEKKRDASIVNTQKMIDKGLRAQLQTQSLITGQLLVQLSFQPDKEAIYRSPGGFIPEMPTIPSTVQELSKTLDKLPLKEIINNINSITVNFDKLLSSGLLKEGLSGMTKTIERAEAVLVKIESEIGPLSEEARKVLKSTDDLISDNNDKLGTLLTDLKETSQTTRTSIVKLSNDLEKITTNTDSRLNVFLETATVTTENAGRMIENQSRFRHELDKSLEELNATLRSIRLLAEYMEQHPEALIQGKKE